MGKKESIIVFISEPSIYSIVINIQKELITKYSESVVERNKNDIFFHKIIGWAFVITATLKISTMDADDDR